MDFWDFRDHVKNQLDAVALHQFKNAKYTIKFAKDVIYDSSYSCVAACIWNGYQKNKLTEFKINQIFCFLSDIQRLESFMMYYYVNKTIHFY